MNLNDVKKIQALDAGQVARSIELLPDQMRQVLGDARLIKVPRDYARASRVAVNGMGGSNLGARIIKSLYADVMKAPVNMEPGYAVPRYADKNTLYLLSSYSGGTEETLSVYRELKKRGAKIIAITAKGRGKLEKLMLKDNVPGYIFSPDHNPSGQPRLGLGYSIFGMSVLLARAGLFSIKISLMEEIIAALEIIGRKLKPEAPAAYNSAKKIALALRGKVPVLVGAEFLAGNLHAARNQINECAKQFSTYLVLPDLNHYAMEGLAFPAGNRQNLVFVFFDSRFYHPRVRQRAELTKQVVKKQGIPVVSHELSGATKPAQSFELLQLGSWVSFYLGILNDVDPVKIPWVDWFKKKLDKRGS